MRAIAREAEEDPDLVKSAPHATILSRLDEARAARVPDLRWRPVEGEHVLRPEGVPEVPFTTVSPTAS